MRPFLHIWQADLAASSPTWLAAEASLSPAELARLGRFHTPLLRQTYARAHGFLRAVLSQYAGPSARALALTTTAYGKPILPTGAPHFNLSYRPGRALLVVSDAAPVGADIEPLAPLPDPAALVADLFSSPEQTALQAALPAAYWPLFYLIWTRKEAYAKALGMGLAQPFRTFAVLSPGSPPRLCSPAGASILSFPAGAGGQGAAAVLTGRAVPAAQHFHYPAE